METRLTTDFCKKFDLKFLFKNLDIQPIKSKTPHLNKTENAKEIIKMNSTVSHEFLS